MTPTALADMLSDGRVSAASGRLFRGVAPQTAHAGGGYLVLGTGVPEIDAALPKGGLKTGATHEWFAPPIDGPETARGHWYPPLTILAHLATKAGAGSDSAAGLLVWVGRRCWPMPAALGGAAERSLFVDPDCDDARFWAIDQALRCPGVGAVIADASRLDMAGSRRLQLAAEAGGTVALLARPSHERGVISAAETRWMVRPESAKHRTQNVNEGGSDFRFALCALRFSLELLRCKGASLGAERRRWVVECVPEVGRETCALRVPADVERGPGEEAGTEERRALRIA